jgi:hypothetical protein
VNVLTCVWGHALHAAKPQGVQCLDLNHLCELSHHTSVSLISRTVESI